MKGWAQRIIGALVLALATAMVFAGTGQATRPDDRSGMLGVGAVIAQAPTASVRPDDRAGLRGPGGLAHEAATVGAIRPDDRAGMRGPGPALVVPATSPATGDSGSFPWAGAALGTGFVLLLGLFAVVLVLNGRFEKRLI